MIVFLERSASLMQTILVEITDISTHTNMLSRLPGSFLTQRALDGARPRCKVCGTTDHHISESGEYIQNPPRK